jgi:hypothetical protein
MDEEIRRANLHQIHRGLTPGAPCADLGHMTAAAAFLRPALRVVGPDERPYTAFCSHCGAHAPNPGPGVRVCGECEAGLLLDTAVGVLPTSADAFLVVDSSLTVQAVSRHAEFVLGVREEHAVNRHITELLIPGTAEPAAKTSLAGAIVRAAAGERIDGRVAVRPTQTFGVRMLARIAACGPPPAALLVLDQPVSA